MGSMAFHIPRGLVRGWRWHTCSPSHEVRSGNVLIRQFHLWVLFKPRALVGVMSHFEDERLKDWKSLRSRNLWGPKNMIFKSCRCQARVRSDLFNGAGHLISQNHGRPWCQWCWRWYCSALSDTFHYIVLMTPFNMPFIAKSVIFGPSFYWLLLLSISPLSVPACWPCWNSGFFNLFLGSREMERSLQPEVHANNANLRQNLQTDWNLWTLPSVAYNAPDLVVVVVDFGKSKDLPMMKRRIYTKMDANGKSDCVEPQNLLQQFSLDDLLRQRNALRFLLWIVRGLNKNELRMKAERWSWITHGWGLQRKSASMLEMRIAHVQDQKEVGALTCYQMFIISLQKLLNLQCLHWKLKFRIKNYPHFRPSQQPQQPCQSLSFAAFWRTVYRWKVWHAGSNRQILQGGHDMPSTLSSQTVGSLEVLAFKCKKILRLPVVLVGFLEISQCPKQCSDFLAWHRIGDTALYLGSRLGEVLKCVALKRPSLDDIFFDL